MSPSAEALFQSDDPADQTGSHAAISGSENESQKDLIDAAADLFVNKCSGCHTIGAGELEGPDLIGTFDWPVNDLQTAIEKMESEVGAFQPGEVVLLLEFMQHEDRVSRLEISRDQAVLEMAASFEPGIVAVGSALFEGSRSLANGGLACNACHAVGASGGGNFALDLTDVYSRMGEMPLLSACENAKFPVMRACYAEHPILKQEAIHLVAFFESVSGAEPEQGSGAGSIVVVGGGMSLAALCMLSVLCVSYRRNRGVRSQLVRGAMKA